MIKIIFVDIDWTILSHKEGHIFDLASIKALNSAHSKGIKIIISSSRPYHSLEAIGAFELLNFDGFILSNGGYVSYDNETLYADIIEKEKVDELIKLVKPLGISLEGIGLKGHALLTKKSKLVDDYHQIYFEGTPKYQKKNIDIISFLLFTGEENDEYIINNLPKGLKYFRFMPFGVDVVKNIHQKGDGVKLILNKLHIKKNEAMAFGDDDADVSMFGKVKYSIAMGNSKKEVKEKSYDVTDDVWNEGVRKSLTKYKII